MQQNARGASGFEWPNGARMAVVVTCLLETWSEGRWPPFSVQTTSLKPGTPDLAAAMWGTYGVKAGVWRLLRILDDNKVPATFCANARALELDPRAAKQIVQSGHEIAAHSYTQDTILAYLDADEERATIRRTADAIERVSGRRPSGWLSPVLAFSERTHAIVAEEGFLWSGDHNNIDLPFCVETGARTVVAVPHSDFADHRVLRANPRDWFDVYKDTFDYLYNNEPTSYLNVTVHCHFGGRPLIAAQIDRILKYIRGFSDIWLVRHDELAQWVLDNKIREWSNAERLGFAPAKSG
jgi:peptidoglycan/xylan/chitin deacetylase (PgdA/CDA1 family)